MFTTRPRDPNKERLWRRRLRHWRDSGLGIAEFCRQQALPVASFYGWRRILAQRDLEATQFVPVRVLGPTMTGATHSAATGLELVLPGGRRLRVGPDFDDATLRRLLSVLEEDRSCS
jgi:hypothetical protein